MTLSASQFALLTYLSNYLYECPLYPSTNYDTACDINLQSKDYDFIIVGGGSAGCAVANRLSENPEWRILLIEAGAAPSNLTEAPGAFFSLQGSPEDWQFKTEPGNFCKGLTNERCNWPQGKALGGGSSINGMMAVKGVDRDYNDWADLGNPGWDWRSMQPYFDKLTTKMKIGTFINRMPSRNLFQESATLLGFKVNANNSWLGYWDFDMTIWNNQRFNAAKGYIVSARDRRNLCVITKKQVTKILFSLSQVNERPKAIGVQLANGLQFSAKKEVIVSAGAINTAQLLMLSGIGPKEHLASLNIPLIQDLPVGKNLQDHLMMVGMFIEIPEDTSATNHTKEFELYCETQEGPVNRADFGTMGFINTKGDSEYPDIETFQFTSLKQDNYALPAVLEKCGFNQESAESLIEINKSAVLFQVLLILLNPKSRGDIRLQSINPDVHPLIDPGYMTDEDDEDMGTMLRGVEHIKSMVAQAPLANLQARISNYHIPNCRHLEFDSRDFWKCSLRNFGSTVYHPAGTCKMGPVEDAEAVVSPELKIYGVDALRVVDASVMPRIVSCNTNIPTIAIAEKASDLIKKDY